MPLRRSLLALGLAAALPATATEVTVLHCGHLFDANSGKLLPQRTVVVKDQRIEEIRDGFVHRGDIPVANGADVTSYHARSLAEHTCMPGWTDLHVHLRGESSPAAYSEGFRLNPEFTVLRAVGYARKTLQAGFTTVRDLGGETALALRDAINQGHIDGPRIHAAGKSIATTGGHGDPTNGLNDELFHAIGAPGPVEGVINSPYEAREAVRQRYKNGSDVIKITATGGVLSYAKSGDAPQFMEDEIKAVVETARDYGYHVAAHAHGKEGIRRAVVGGVTTIEHGTYMDEEIFKLMKQHGTWYVPTISAGKFVAEKAKIEGYYPAIIRPKAARIGALIQDTFGKAYQAGVKIAFGTDAGVSLHGDNAEEFVFMVEAGMPPAEALRAATIHAAEVLGTTADQGTLEAGKLADIVAVPGNPLQDITAVRKVAFVMKDGKVYKQ